ncbi:MAG: CapA family protein, partial [Lachnospiraceae bacterium]|nr:CapA family protein [Lachnospiraceae bacterium]
MDERRKMDEKEARRRAIARQKRRRKRIWQRRILIAAMVLIVLLFVLLVRGISKSIHQKAEKKKEAEALRIEQQERESQVATATITTAGDIIMHSPFLQSSVYLQDGKYHYDDIFKYVKDVYEGADFAVTVPEFALTGEDYSGYPTFHSPDAIAESLAVNGIDMCLLANNHIYDGLGDGLLRTMDVLKENNILYAGAQKSKEDKDYV